MHVDIKEFQVLQGKYFTKINYYHHRLRLLCLTPLSTIFQWYCSVLLLWSQNAVYEAIN